ncbi:MAG: DUF3990 domain-containing protein [Clostridiales bacterium]|nr:DUF3990 domain-containing protein [Clostridiales bacterium]
MYHELKSTLYHGTISKITDVDVTAGRSRKDFGKGFYMAVSKQQAIGMMHKKYREAVRRSRNKENAVFHEYLYEVELNLERLNHMKVKVFETADSEWLDFVLMCRKKGGMPHDYDFVAGATADDDTALCLKAYEEGLYGETGSPQAKETLLKNLEVENLGIQYFIGKQNVADTIIKSIREIDWR